MQGEKPGKKTIQIPDPKATKYAPETKMTVKIDNHKATGYSGSKKGGK